MMAGAYLRHGLYAMLACGALVTTWMHGFAWIGAGGNLLNLPSFFADSYHGGDAAAFLTIDIAVVWAVFMAWVVADARAIGLGVRWGWVFIALSFLGTCFAFP
ncbi:MAG: DUF2834 domain-containing protein, partial [Sphingopyxis sp.]